jgi:hypothetical protein
MRLAQVMVILELATQTQPLVCKCSHGFGLSAIYWTRRSLPSLLAYSDRAGSSAAVPGNKMRKELSNLSAYPARNVTMRRMTWHDFTLLGAGLVALGVIATFYPDGDGMTLRSRLLFGVSFAAVSMAIILLASVFY